MIERASHYEGFDMMELGFMFALEKIDKRVGKVRTSAHSWTSDGVRNRTEINMVDCADFLGMFYLSN